MIDDLVRLTDTEGRPVFVHPDSVRAIWTAGVPGCSTVVHGEYGCSTVLGNVEDVHAVLAGKETSNA